MCSNLVCVSSDSKFVLFLNVFLKFELWAHFQQTFISGLVQCLSWGHVLPKVLCLFLPSVLDYMTILKPDLFWYFYLEIKNSQGKLLVNITLSLAMVDKLIFYNLTFPLNDIVFSGFLWGILVLILALQISL